MELHSADAACSRISIKQQAYQNKNLDQFFSTIRVIEERKQYKLIFKFKKKGRSDRLIR